MGNLHSYSEADRHDGRRVNLSTHRKRALPPAPQLPDADLALKEALEQLLNPIAQLCLARGMSFAAVEEMLKRAFVETARAGNPAMSGHRDISRVSAATGLTRREVTRITMEIHARAAVRPSPATQIFTRWMSSRRLHDNQGNPRPLRRQGRAPSFESLAQSVTRDVHPRTLLAELCRLGLAQVDERTDTVSLVRNSFVPREDQARMFGFLGSNVGDHMAAAVDNVLADSPPHVEQAIFADELSGTSLAKVRELVAKQWKSFLTAMVPALDELIEADAKAGRTADRRVRIGLYSYHARVNPQQNETED